MRTPNRRTSLLAALLATGSLAAGQAGDLDTWIGYETRQYAGYTLPYDLAVADLDLDGYPDAALAGYWATAELTVMWNRGDGSFDAPEAHAQSAASYAVIAADLDGDGLPDLVTTDHGVHGNATTVSVLLNQGDRSLAPAVQYPAGAGPVGLAAADFDLDGDLDLAVALYGHLGQGNQVALLVNDGAGAFGPPQLFAAGASPYRIAAGDLTGDGAPDLVVARDKGKLSVLRNTLAGFAPPTSYTVTAQPQGGDAFPNVQVGDTDQDGDLDVLYSSTKTSMGTDPSFGAVAVLPNDGAGALGAPVREPVVSWLGGAASSAVADLDGDGALDYLAVHLDAGGWTYMHGDGAGGFEPGTEVPGGQAPVAVAVADADADGLLDALVVNRDSFELYVHRGLPGGEFAVHPGRDLLGFSHDVAAADVDMDGDLDVAAAGGYAGSGNVELVLNDGSGGFGPPTQVHLGAAAMAVKFRDLNGDGAPDLLWCDHPTANPYDFWAALNDGTGGFLAPVEWPLGTCGNGDVDAFDMDGDGDLDVFTAEALGCSGVFGNRMFISRNRGDGTFDPPTTYAAILRPQRIAHGDVDLDGDEDLVYGVAAGLELARSNGDGSFQPPVAIPLPGGGNAPVVADLTGDGVPDLAATTANGPQGVNVYVLHGLGGGTFAAPLIYTAGFSPDLKNADEMMARDADGDGDLDLFALNGGDGNVSLLRNRGDGAFARQVRYGLGPSSTSFAAGDFDGDGVLDLVGAVGIPPSNLSKELVTVFGRPQCPAPSSYCTAKTNSLGLEARMGWSGTPSAFAGDFSIHVQDGVPGQPGIAFYSSTGPASLPFLGGTLCAQGPLIRLPVLYLDGTGSAGYELEVSPSMVGSSRWYQFWYRDPQHPDGTNVSLSDALAVSFCE